MALALPTHRVNAQQQRFRATPLVKLGDFSPDPDNIGTAGINNKGQVVYGKNLGTLQEPDYRAWVWLPSSDYNLDAGVHELGGQQAIARDINEAGDIAGQVNGVGVDMGSGAVWRLANGLTPTTLGNFGGQFPWSSAHAISDHTPPKIAGDSGAIRNCPCDGTLNGPVTRGFSVELGSSLVELLPGDQTVSFARDIVKPFQQSTFQIAGFGVCLGLPSNPPTACKNAVDPCNTFTDPKLWINSASPNDLAKLSANDAAAYAINIHGASAGYAFTAGGIGCRQHAVYWPTATSNPVDLHENVLDPDFRSGAEGMNNLQPPQIVGGSFRTTALRSCGNQMDQVGACLTFLPPRRSARPQTP